MEVPASAGESLGGMLAAALEMQQAAVGAGDDQVGGFGAGPDDQGDPGGVAGASGGDRDRGGSGRCGSAGAGGDHRGDPLSGLPRPTPTAQTWTVGCL
jgi:hypothetical protein